MSLKQELKVVTQPQEYFRELVTETLGQRRLRVTQETEFYLVNLLSQFMNTENLYVRDSEGHMRDEPLVLMLKEAMEQAQNESQKILFRQVGDVSLYMAGYFQESLNRKLVNLNYYIGMGETAYQQVAIRAEETLSQSLFKELATKFSSLVDVFAEISTKTTSAKNEADLLRFYELWKTTGSERAAKVLSGAGIVLNSDSDDEIQ